MKPIPPWLAVLAGLLMVAPSFGAESFSVLVFSKTLMFRHASITNGVKALRKLGDQNGFRVDATENADVFTPSSLDKYRVVIFLSTSGNVLDSAQEQALKNYLEKGGGFVGVHAAVAGKVATEGDWPWYVDTLCTEFANHKAIEPAMVLVEDTQNPSMSHLPEKWSRTDEWYNFTASPRSRVHVLATLDEKSFHGGTMGADHPVAWCRKVGQGRLWYTALGHTDESFAEPDFLKHLLGGIRIAAGTAPSRFEPDPVAKR